MHIYITGGSGRNGSLAITAALERGHTVTALVRSGSSSSLTLPAHCNLTILHGSPLHQPSVAAALTTPRPASAVLFTLSLARTSTSPFAPLRPDSTPDFMSQAMRALLAAVAASPTPPKLVINSTLGAGDSWHALSWPFRLLFSQTPMRFGVADHTVVDGLVRGGSGRFVLARAARLTEQKEGEQLAAVRVLPENGKGLGLMDALTRQSLARWMVIAAEQDTWDGTSPVLVNEVLLVGHGSTRHL